MKLQLENLGFLSKIKAICAHESRASLWNAICAHSDGVATSSTVNEHGKCSTRPRRGPRTRPICAVVARYFSKLPGFARGLFIIVRSIPGYLRWERLVTTMSGIVVEEPAGRVVENEKREKNVWASKGAKNVREHRRLNEQENTLKRRKRKRIGERVNISERINVYMRVWRKSQKESKHSNGRCEWQGEREWVVG